MPHRTSSTAQPRPPLDPAETVNTAPFRARCFDMAATVPSGEPWPPRLKATIERVCLAPGSSSGAG
ncbi:hypothetical protein GCM10010431_10520 [Streptomyces kunmingensis]